MTRRHLVYLTIRGVAVLLTAAVCGACVVVILSATVLAVEPDEPRDRAAPPLTGGEDPLRITVVGTSLSSAGRYRWPDEVGTQLARRIGRTVEVQRVTKPGASSSWGAEHVEQVLETDPHVVLLEFSVNDADIGSGMTVGSSIKRHDEILAALRSSGRKITVVLLTMNPAAGPRGLARPFLSRYYSAYVELAQQHDAGLIDLYPRWLEVPVADRDISDGLHPSDAAATRVIVEPVVGELSRASGVG